MINDFIKRAKNGKSVYICEVRDAFISSGRLIRCVIETTAGEIIDRSIPLPCVCGNHYKDEEERKFIREYFYSNIYNMISAYGGKAMTIYVSQNDRYIDELCGSLSDVFQVDFYRADRSGYGKCLNVTDRVNAAMGSPPFQFSILYDIYDKKEQVNKVQTDSITAFKKTVRRVSSSVIIGLDIGGTDIKAVGAVNGRLAAFCEYDWYPAGMTKIEQLTDGVNYVVDRVCKELGAFVKPDGIGVGFPDVVLMNKIVGGETLKTRGIRNSSKDYETEFSELLKMEEMLLAYCKPGGVVNMTNDGWLAAYTAAVELAHSNRADEIKKGIIAHTLGTELGTGWIDENGKIPQIPLEIYNCVVDLGDYSARKYESFDLRSILNFNTEIPGTLQKYPSQSGAYRLAVNYFKKFAPDIYMKLVRAGFIEEKGSSVFVVISPEDMRKPLLEYIMKLADDGQPQAEEVFREIGRYLAATWRETEFLLSPKVKRRILYGRFIKSSRCLSLLQEGANDAGILNQNITGCFGDILEAGDDDLAFTPLMQALRDDLTYTVAQFGQAVGAVYFAAEKLH